MIYTISNEFLSANISSKGAMLESLKDLDETEYIWQRDPNYWNLSDINIFPYVARLTKETYHYAGNNYHMGIHGFLWQSELEVFKEEKDNIIFQLTDSVETRKQYPFSFEFLLKRELIGHKLITTYLVSNRENKRTMYFGIGGHPAFKLPISNSK